MFDCYWSVPFPAVREKSNFEYLVNRQGENHWHYPQSRANAMLYTPLTAPAQSGITRTEGQPLG